MQCKTYFLFATEVLLAFALLTPITAIASEHFFSLDIPAARVARDRALSAAAKLSRDEDIGVAWQFERSRPFVMQ
jgi:hypothetical protein